MLVNWPKLLLLDQIDLFQLLLHRDIFFSSQDLSPEQTPQNLFASIAEDTTTEDAISPEIYAFITQKL